MSGLDGTASIHFGQEEEDEEDEEEDSSRISQTSFCRSRANDNGPPTEGGRKSEFGIFVVKIEIIIQFF